jgi:ADP-L-glycero-D-manno-heptose 6-epimerase
MILLTGAAGFIGSCLHSLLLQRFPDHKIVIVDDFGRPEKARNYQGKQVWTQVNRGQLQEWLASNGHEVKFVLHMGARTDTAEMRKEVFDALNLDYSKQVWKWCAEHQVPLIYASSAATYGDGSLGFSDDPSLLPSLKPLNPYGQSKHDFDLWAMGQSKQPPYWAGLKFFNVFGPNEYHKGRMASVVFHAYHQIRQTGRMRLFRSHRPDYQDGEQRRDFIYVRDLAEVIFFLMEKRPASGIFNLGSGQARSFNDLVKAVFMAMGLEPAIDFIDTPADIRDSYQYFTEADMSRVRALGFDLQFPSLERNVQEYVSHYLMATPEGKIF